MSHSTQRVSKNYRQIIVAPPAHVFPLLCPVREKAWLKGWDYQMIYSLSGYAEAGCIFSTAENGMEAIWVISEYDPENGRLQFIKTVPSLCVTQLEIDIQPSDCGNQSRVDITYRYTALTPAGQAQVEQITDAVFAKRLKFWEDSMNHYITTGNQWDGAA